MISDNPFVSKIFVKTWLKYFKKPSDTYLFEFIKPILFVKSKYSLYFFNVGRNLTNGIFYSIDNTFKDFKGKVFVLFDVLPYLGYENNRLNLPNRIKIKKVKQYKGYLTRISQFNDFEDFFLNHFSGKSRNNIRKWNKRLTNNFEIEFKVFYGVISKDEYHKIFNAMLALIQKRWGSLGMDNDIYRDRDYYRELCYEMILDKTASLNVIYAFGEPIAVSICFVSKKDLFFAITTFDIDFRKYNMGHLLIMYIMQWCFDNRIEVFDYSKGTYEYKTRWSNETYFFENHIIYDKTSLKSLIIGNYLTFFYSFKQFLREKEFNLLYSRFKYHFKNLGWKDNDNIVPSFKIKDVNDIDLTLFEKIEMDSIDFNDIRGVLYDILFSKPQYLNTVEVYKDEIGKRYLLVGEKFKKEIIL
ncbi:GNAT family N-acetyltransferase [uncultured Croceitalea sp.]|uniref:GNAT family N-acetyltransferase n=1 Tax=uncultured Croceitalea sp. TaxID=1798908 RepID=UPI00374EDB1E